MSDASPSPWKFIGWRLIVFLFVFATLQLGWQALRGTAVEYAVVHHGTVQPAAFLVNLFTPDVHAAAVEFSVRAPGGGLNILNGCEGLEALFLLCAAFMVAPFGWRSKAVGFAVGAVVVFIVNQARILGLFYAYRLDRSLFEPLHGTVAPLVVIFAIGAYFYIWLSMTKRHAEPA